MLTSQKLSASLATAPLRQNIKKSMFEELFDDVIASSPPNSRSRLQPFDATDENPFLDTIPAPSAGNSKGKTRPTIVAPPEPKLQAPNPPPAPIRTARERVKFLFTQNPDYFSPSLILEATKKGTFLIHMLGLFLFHSCQRT